MVAARLYFPSGTDLGDDLVGALTASCPRSLLAAFLVPASPPPALSGEVPQSLLLSPCGAPALSSILPSTFRAAGRMRLGRFGSCLLLFGPRGGPLSFQDIPFIFPHLHSQLGFPFALVLQLFDEYTLLLTTSTSVLVVQTKVNRPEIAMTGPIIRHCSSSATIP